MGRDEAITFQLGYDVAALQVDRWDQIFALYQDAELTKKGEVTLRTDYELNDETFYEITDAVYAIMDDDTDLYGYYWLGVIYLTTER